MFTPRDPNHSERMRLAILRRVAGACLNEDGASTAEYAIVLVMVAVGAVAAVAAFGGHLAAVWAPFASTF